MYSNRWWFWSEAGRGVWKECKAKGKDSPYWKENKCDTRQKPAKGSKWWWWTKTGRKVWTECKEKGDTSPFWKENDCEAGRCDRLYNSLYLQTLFSEQRNTERLEIKIYL